MEYTKSYTAKDEHIDVQGIMDGLYYPFYMEYCRHDFVKEVLEFDILNEANSGINMVLTQYTIKFLRPLKKGDTFLVTCELLADKSNKPIFYLHQKILSGNKVMTEAIFSATCVRASGGRPYLPETIVEKIQSAPPLENHI